MHLVPLAHGKGHRHSPCGEEGGDMPALPSGPPGSRVGPAEEAGVGGNTVRGPALPALSPGERSGTGRDVDGSPEYEAKGSHLLRRNRFPGEPDHHDWTSAGSRTTALSPLRRERKARHVGEDGLPDVPRSARRDNDQGRRRQKNRRGLFEGPIRCVPFGCVRTLPPRGGRGTRQKIP